MKKTIFTLFVLILLVGCNQPEEPKEYNFMDGFNKIMELDEKYNADFRTERLNKTMVKVQNIDNYLEEIEQLQKEIRNIPNNDTEYLDKFLIARKNMLLAEKNWQLGMAVGNRGRANDGFLCTDTVYLKEATPYFENTVLFGKYVGPNLDYILQERDDLKQVIGIDNTKPKFYHSPLDYVVMVIEHNKKAIEICTIAKNQNEAS